MLAPCVDGGVNSSYRSWAWLQLVKCSRYRLSTFTPEVRSTSRVGRELFYKGVAIRFEISYILLPVGFQVGRCADVLSTHLGRAKVYFLRANDFV